MSDVMMSIGSHYFFVPLLGHDTPAFETVARETSYNWAMQSRLSREPAMQFVGEGEDQITIEGRLFPMHFGGFSTINGIRESGKIGKPLPLIKYYPQSDEYLAAGEFIDDFVIRRIRTQNTHFGPTGVQHRVEFTLDLTRFGRDVGDAGARNISYPNDRVDRGQALNDGAMA